MGWGGAGRGHTGKGFGGAGRGRQGKKGQARDWYEATRKGGSKGPPVKGPPAKGHGGKGEGDAPPRPAWLPTTGPGNLNVPPEDWGMTLRQWAAFIMGCAVASPQSWRVLADSTHRKRVGDVNLYQICDTYVKPWTRNLGSSVALLLNGDAPLKAELMVSHAWGEDIVEAMVAVLSKAFVSGIELGTPIWFCTFAQYQPGDEAGDCGPGVADQLAMDPFGRVIKSGPRHGMLVVHTTAAELYTRLWCVYEVNAAQDARVDPFAAMSMRYCQAAVEALDGGRGVRDICRCDSAAAECWSPEDLRMIKAQITGGIGHEALDRKIVGFRSASLQRALDSLQPILDWARLFLRQGGVPEGEVHLQTVTLLAETIRHAGLYVGFHCLATVAEAHEAAGYLEHIDELVCDHVLDLIKCDNVDGRDIGLPPGFDPAKRVPDADIEALKSDAARRRAHLMDLGAFQHPIGWLELGGGGNIMAVGTAEVGAHAVERVMEAFKRFDARGSGSISNDLLKRVLTSLGGGAAGLSEGEIDRLLAAAGAGGDGEVDCEGFLRWLFRQDTAAAP